MSKGIKIGGLPYVSKVAQEVIFLCGCFPARTYAIVSLIIPILSSVNSAGCKTLPVSHAQKNLTSSRNLPFKTRFENVR